MMAVFLKAQHQMPQPTTLTADEPEEAESWMGLDPDELLGLQVAAGLSGMVLLLVCAIVCWCTMCRRRGSGGAGRARKDRRARSKKGMSRVSSKEEKDASEEEDEAAEAEEEDEEEDEEDEEEAPKRKAKATRALAAGVSNAFATKPPARAEASSPKGPPAKAAKDGKRAAAAKPAAKPQGRSPSSEAESTSPEPNYAAMQEALGQQSAGIGLGDPDAVQLPKTPQAQKVIESGVVANAMKVYSAGMTRQATAPPKQTI
jgi:hypothetical protein